MDVCTSRYLCLHLCVGRECACACVHLCLYVCVCVSPRMYRYISMYGCVGASMYVCTLVSMKIFVRDWLQMYECLHVCACAHVCIHAFTHAVMCASMYASMHVNSYAHLSYNSLEALMRFGSYFPSCIVIYQCLLRSWRLIHQVNKVLVVEGFKSPPIQTLASLLLYQIGCWLRRSDILATCSLSNSFIRWNSSLVHVACTVWKGLSMRQR